MSLENPLGVWVWKAHTNSPCNLYHSFLLVLHLLGTWYHPNYCKWGQNINSLFTVGKVITEIRDLWIKDMTTSYLLLIRVISKSYLLQHCLGFLSLLRPNEVWLSPQWSHLQMPPVEQFSAWCSKSGHPQASSISSSKELTRNANFSIPFTSLPRPAESETLGVELSNLCFTKLSKWSWDLLKLEKHWSYSGVLLSSVFKL